MTGIRHLCLRSVPSPVFLHILTRSPPRSPNPCSVSSRSAGCGNSSISRSLQATRCRFRPELAEEKPLEICFSHVSFSHPGGDKRILDDVSFTLHAGEHTALVGINGAGKSTIVKLICGLYQPTEGNITINGHSPWQSESGTVLQSNRGGLSGPVCTLVFDCRKCELLPTGRDRS